MVYSPSMMRWMAEARPVAGSQVTSAPHILGFPLAASNLPGIAGEEFVQHQFFFHADDAVVRAAHAHIGLERRSARQNALVRRGNMRVRAQNRRHAPVQIPPHGNFLAGGLGVEIHHDHFGLDPGQQRIGGAKGIVDRRHKDAALQLHHRVVHAACGGSFKDAVTRQAGLKIRRPQHAPRALLCCRRRAEFR